MELEDKLITDKYLVTKYITKGNFGSIFSGKNLKNEKAIVLKFEKKGSKFLTIKHEVKILKYLYDNKIKNVPTVFWFGPYENYLCFIMDEYDISLYDYIECKKMSKKKISSIFIQTVLLLESIHEVFLVHRDIKPQNIMVHNGELILIDFGFSIFYIDANKKHIVDNKDLDTMIGSINYASYFMHDKYRPYRRDDLISALYIILYTYYRDLPWFHSNMFTEKDENIHLIDTNRNQEIKKYKSLSSIKTLCENIDIHIFEIAKYLYNLTYFEEPNYLFIIDLIKNI